MEYLFEEDIKNFVDQFNGRFELIDFGFPNNEYLKYGFWLKLRANFDVHTKSFKVGVINFIINGRDIYVDRGYLNDIAYGLSMIS